MRWTSNPKKQWCFDCWTTHRTVLENEVALANMTHWLTDPANRQKFALYLIAYLSIKKQAEVRRITKQLILQQVDCFQVLSRLMCIPLGPCAVRPLAQALAARSEGASHPATLPEDVISYYDENGAVHYGLFEAVPLNGDTINRPERDQ